MPIAVQYLKSSTKGEQRFKQHTTWSKWKKFSSKIVHLDLFGQGFSMKLDKGIMTLKTVSGLLITIMLIIVLVFYATVKFKSLISQRNVDIIIAKTENFFNYDHVFDFEKGLNMAVGLTAYDSETEYILDKSIGELNFMAYEWGEDENKELYVRKTIIPSHICSKEELGLEGDNSSFFPLFKGLEN